MKLFIGCGSSENINLTSKEACVNLIKDLSKIEDVDIVLGGASSGLLKECYQAFIKENKKVTLFLDKTREQENKVYQNKQTIISVLETTMDRTKTCYLESDMALFLEGGMGTFAEIWSFLEEKRTSLRDYPILLYNEKKVNQAILDLLHTGVSRKMITESDTKHFVECKTKIEVINLVKEFIKRKEN